MNPQIVLVVTDQETNAQISKLGVGFLELRVDLFKSTEVDYALKQFKNRRKLGLPLILTVRDQKKEGAVKAMPRSRKRALLEALMPLTDWVDIELSSPVLLKTIELARKLNKRIIISVHDFQRVPKNLEQLLKNALVKHPEIVKMAIKANSQDDLMRMVAFTRLYRQFPLVTMCLGPWGALSRMILPATGSRWIYTFLHKPTAPGQIDIKTLKSHLKLYYRKT